MVEYYSLEKMHYKDIITEITMLRNSFDGIFVLVEGINDMVVYRNFFKEGKVIIRYTDGKENVVKIVENLNESGIQGVIGIIDADYDNYFGKQYSIDNLFQTDGYDLETMVFFSPAFDKVISIYCNKERIKRFENKCKKKLKDTIIGHARSVGFFRLLSFNFKLNFNNIEYGYFIKSNGKYLDKEKMIKAISFKSNPTKITIKSVISKLCCRIKCYNLYSSIVEDLNKLEMTGCNYMRICCGDDLLSALVTKSVDR
ncbi:MAG: DUF4435 domain-containing protein [Deltaproteobacteria bacterium]|nr:DUF4435 domain-containing protein [Candidatus Zymogenaceae bacterium]